MPRPSPYKYLFTSRLLHSSLCIQVLSLSSSPLLSLGCCCRIDSIMSSSGKLSHKQKGKAVVTTSSPARDVSEDTLEEFESVHREAIMDTGSLNVPQRLLVSESARLHLRVWKYINILNNLKFSPCIIFVCSRTGIKSNLLVVLYKYIKISNIYIYIYIYMCVCTVSLSLYIHHLWKKSAILIETRKWRTTHA